MLPIDRRRFLAWAAASPLLTAQDSSIITGPKDAITIMDFEPAARAKLPPAHWGYLATGVEDDATLRANRDGYSRILIRPRRLVDISKIDTRVDLFGSTWDFPIGLCPVGNMRAFHPEGELPVARAAQTAKATQILSTMTTSPIEEVVSARGGPVWYQLYTSNRWDVTERLVGRAEAAGCPVMAVTVDTQAGRRTETFERFKRLDKRDCTACHSTKSGERYKRMSMFSGIDTSAGGLSGHDPASSWTLLPKLKKLSKMKLLVKGIETGEDARLCLDNGADGIIVSNHGGRAGETGRGTIECLPEVVDAVAGRAPVLIDGGIRRGADVYKAIALGARAVCIGRPYLWGLTAFGQPGVERVIAMLRAEFELVMKQSGARSLAEIGKASVIVRG